jgi:hypothetical protein
VSSSATVVAAVLGALMSSARADVVVVDNDKTVEVDCAKDPAINLLGNNITVKAKGVCAKITIAGNHETVTGSAKVVYVAGNHNTVVLAAADDVTVDGNNNTVSVARSVTRKAPRITGAGTDNHLKGPK